MGAAEPRAPDAKAGDSEGKEGAADDRRVSSGPVRAAAAVWGVSNSTAARWISVGFVPDPKQIVPGE